MSFEVKLSIWLVSIGIVLGSLLGAYEYGRHVEGIKRENEALKERLVYAEAFTDAQTANDKLKTDGVKQHAQDTETINRIRDDFSDFRLRMPKAKNCHSDGVSNTSSGIMDGTTGGGLRAEAEQAAADRFSDGLKQDSYRLDTIIDSCRVVMNWARGLCKFDDACKVKL